MRKAVKRLLVTLEELQRFTLEWEIASKNGGSHSSRKPIYILLYFQRLE